jgi:hypothetical protein
MDRDWSSDVCSSDLTYTPQSEDDRSQEKYMTWTIYAFVFAYIAFLIWREIP